MKYSHLYIFLLLFSFICQISAQTFEEYKKQQQAAMQEFAEKQTEGMERLRKEYAEYVAQRDKEWADYLLKEWQNYQAFVGKKMPQRPKPTDAPTCEMQTKETSPTDTKQISVAAIRSSTPSHLIPQQVEPIRKPIDASGRLRTINFNFYGKTLSVPYDIALSRASLTGVNQSAIAKFWEDASATNYTPTVEQLLQMKIDLNINDYGYLQMVQQLAENLYQPKSNLSRLLTWFIMVRSGYGVRIAFQDNAIGLLLPTLQEMYEVRYVNLSGVNYYVYPKLNAGSFYTYDKDYQTSGRMMDLAIHAPINFSGKKAYKNFSFTFEDKAYQIKLQYDPDLIEFYKAYPLVDLGIYFNAPVSIQAKESIADALLPIVSDMDEAKAAAFLLSFIHQAFPYKTDPEQFGREKFFFAEELFYYPYSDCEDRAVLYTYLVRETLGLKAIGLEYSDHVAAAVAFTQPAYGDYLTYENTRFTVTDPTYINAPVGLSMPQYKTVSPIVRKVNNRSVEDMTLDKQWEKLQAAGFYKGSIRKNAKQLTDGNMLLTGYFAEPAALGSVMLSGKNNAHNCFVAKLNRSGQTIWAKAIAASENAVGMSIESTPTGNIVVAGVFTGSIRLDGKSISAASGQADLFIASFSPSGNLLWLNKGGLDIIPDNSATAFSVAYNANGVLQSLQHAEDQLEEQAQGLFIDEANNIFYSGITNNALALSGNEKSVAFASAESLDVIALLQAETAHFVGKQADKAMAGLMAAIKLVRFMGVSLTGEKIRETIDRTNPDFKKSSPNIYKNLAKINFVKNEKGVISIQTVGGGDISFDKVKISNKSTISISELSSGDYKVDVLSGIKVGKLVVWYGLNYIKMFAKKGDLLFDYASDNSQVTVNVQKDILN